MAPRACVRRIIPLTVIENIKELVRVYREVPISQLTTLYYYRYNEMLDACLMGFDTGLEGLIRHMPDAICMTTDSKLTLHQDERSPRTKVADKNHRIKFIRALRDTINYGQLFDPDNALVWNRNTEHLLRNISKVILVKSPYELLYSKDRGRTIREKNAIQKSLSHHPMGIYVCQLTRILQIDKVFFNVCSIGQLVSEYPELFYHHESKHLGIDDHVFDSSKTFCDVDEFNFEALDINPWTIAIHCFLTGLYQKTLILLKVTLERTGPKGLKLGVWFNALQRNFHEYDEDANHGPLARLYQHLLSMQPLHVALALDYLKLIILSPGQEIRNDLRLHLPKPIPDFEAILLECRARVKKLNRN